MLLKVRACCNFVFRFGSADGAVSSCSRGIVLLVHYVFRHIMVDFRFFGLSIDQGLQLWYASSAACLFSSYLLVDLLHM